MAVNITSLIIEAKTSSEEKLTHLEHAEDHPLNAGVAGFEHARDTLQNVHDSMRSGAPVSISTKYDGSPSIVFGHHPETGQFFVASKSAFNKTPKLNYSEEDIDNNHGRAPGLAAKLKTALKQLPKVTPKEGVYQGDIMHSGGKRKNNPEGDVSEHGGKAHFTPNTITYSTNDPEEQQKALGSKLGVAVHTAYHGPTFAEMKATYNAGSTGFGNHKDVHLLDVSHPGAKLSDVDSDQFNYHMGEAGSLHDALSKKGGYKVIGKHSDRIKEYINHTVRTGEIPSSDGYKTFAKSKNDKAAEKFKTAAKKQALADSTTNTHNEVDANQEHFDNMFAMHSHLQKAKNILTHALAKGKQRYDHSVGGKKVKPEGFVVSLNNRPSKLVDREEFSRLNFERSANR